MRENAQTAMTVDPSGNPIPWHSAGDLELDWDPEDAAHVAGWSPVVALAVANLLDNAAARSETKVQHGAVPRHVWSHERDALAVAAAYLDRDQP